MYCKDCHFFNKLENQCLNKFKSNIIKTFAENDRDCEGFIQKQIEPGMNYLDPQCVATRESFNNCLNNK